MKRLFALLLLFPLLCWGSGYKPAVPTTGGNYAGSSSYDALGLPPAPTNSVLPVVTGNNWEGQTLSTTNGTWTNSPTSYTYQWTADGTNIGAATSSTYVLATGQAEKVVRCVVTAHNAGGTGNATSDPTATVMGNPITIFGTDLAAWYDPSDAISITQSGGLVSQINDKSGNNYHLTATGTARPTYSATGVLSNAGGLSFDGSANIMSAASVNIGTTAVSVLTLSETDETGANNPLVELVAYKADGDAGDYGANSNIFFLVRDGAIESQAVSAHLANTDSIALVGPLQKLYSGVFLRMGTVFDGINHQIFIDNQGSSQVAAALSMHTPGTLSVGGRLGGTQLWKGTLGETIVVKKAVSSAERLKMNAWFTRAWSKILVCEGDSIVHEGPGFKTLGGTFTSNFGYAYVSVPNISPKAFLDDIAIGGTDFQTNVTTCQVDRTAAYTNVRLPTEKYGKKYILYFAYSNQLCGGLHGGSAITPAAYAAAVGAWCLSQKAAGWDKIVTSTVLSRTDAQANDTNRNAYNAIITGAGWKEANGVDAIADFAADSIMGVDAAPTVNPTYFADTVHPGQTGHARLEPIFTATINGL